MQLDVTFCARVGEYNILLQVAKSSLRRVDLNRGAEKNY